MFFGFAGVWTVFAGVLALFAGILRYKLVETVLFLSWFFSF